MNESTRNGDIWEQFLELTQENIVDLDLETHALRCSAALVRNARLTPETFPHTLEQWFELYHPEDYAQSRNLLRLVEEGKDSFSLERRFYCGDGQYRRFRLDAFCLRDRQGRTTRMIGAETDLSWQNFYERRLTDQQDLAQKLQNDLTDARHRADNLAARLARSETRSEALEKQLRMAKRLANATSDLLFLRDENGRTVLCNDAFSEAAVQDPSIVATAREARDGEEYRYKDRHGRIRNLLAHTYSFSDDCATMTGETGAFSDRTEIDEMETDMLRLRRLLGKKSDRSDENASTCRHAAVKDDSSGDDLFEEDCDLLDSRKIPGGWLNGALLAMRGAANMTGADFFPERTAQIEALIRLTDEAELKVGIVGITSSGKSTFINAMMGERLLPEETRATTNLVVRCRKGEIRAVTVVLKNGEHRCISGSALTPALMENLASERLNPANEQGIALLEWTSPGAALPEGLVLIDTPGLDAFGFPEHSELVLRQLLPSLDIVLYITSIRNRFKSADLELLSALLEQDQRVIFLLSQIDLEQDDTEGGRVVLSRRRKLAAQVSELREDIARTLPGETAVVPISSKLALAHFYDRDSVAWTASNFGPLIRQMEVFQAHLSRYRTETRGRRALSLLSHTASDIVLTLGGISTEQAEAEGAARLEKIRELRDAWRWANAEVSAVRNEWRRLLDPRHHLERLKRGIERASTLKEAKDCYERWGSGWGDLTAQMTLRMDRARLSCRDLLAKYDATPRERAGEVADIKSELPTFYRYVLHETKDVRVRGWFEDLEFWPRHQVFFRQEVDREKMLEGAEELTTERLRLLNDHLTWWENQMREDYCNLLYEVLTQEEAALADIRRIATDASVSRSALRQALQGVREAERGIKSGMTDLSLPELDSGSLLPENLFERYDDSSLTTEFLDEHEESGIFAPLLAAFHEQNLLSRFLATEALRGHRRIVLLGLRRHDSLRFLSRLAHDASLVDGLRTQDGSEIDERDWIFCGRTPPPMPHIRLAVPETLLREIEILIAPGDGLCDASGSSAVDWDALFAEWLPVVHLDIARIDSGLSDLARAPYTKALFRLERWVAASGQGALFGGRLSDLLTDVPDRLDDFFLRGNCRGTIDCFVYENYDARYTDFLLWGRGARDDEQDMIEKWIEEGHDFAPPFSEYRLRRALEGAKRKCGTARKRSVAD